MDLTPSDRESFLGKDPRISTPENSWQEWEIQSYIVQQARRAGLFIEGDQNAAKRGFMAAARAKACGMMAGTPDLRVLKDNGKIVFIEVKKGKGKLSSAQKEWHSKAESLSHEVYTIYVDTPVMGWQAVLIALRRGRILMTQEWQTIDRCPRIDLTTTMLGVNMRGTPPYEVFTFKNTFIPDEQYTNANPEACWRQPYAEWPCYPTHWMPLPPPPILKG